jgi:hypothetical protein
MPVDPLLPPSIEPDDDYAGLTGLSNTQASFRDVFRTEIKLTRTPLEEEATT